MVSHYLVVEDLLLLQLLQHSLDLLSHLQVPHSLLLLIGRAVVSHLEQDTLVVDSLLLDLGVEGVYLGTELLGLVVREVDGS
jgi:hydroxylamine reductase (hybrid-cluster protein)